MRRELIPFIEQAIRAEVQAAIQDLFCEKHKDTGIAASEGYLWDECPTCEIQIAEANALRKAADQLDAIYPERTRGAADGLLKKCIETVLSLSSHPHPKRCWTPVTRRCG